MLVSIEKRKMRVLVRGGSSLVTLHAGAVGLIRRAFILGRIAGLSGDRAASYSGTRGFDGM